MSDVLAGSALTPLLWAAAQATAVTAAAALACVLAGRAGPRAGGRAALCGLAAAAVLTVAAFSPWPRWGGGQEPVLAAAFEAADAPREANPNAGVSLAAARAFVGALIDPPGAGAVLESSPEAEGSRSLGFGAGTTRPEPRRPVRWGALIAAGLVLAGVGRFAAGWAQVARLRRGAAAVTDDDAVGEFQSLKAAAGVAGPVELLETPDLNTAAAVGCRRPAVLLPAGWRAWSAADRRAVLAHELAHVAAGDFSRNLLAQALLLTQWYHPLSHHLAGRVRAAQEVAADAAAAALVGGRRDYLKSLAAVALTADDGGRDVKRRQAFPSPAAAAWPARAFLPTSRSLHERVTMLRRPPVPRSRLARASGPLCVAGVVAVAAVASGFRAAPAREPAPQPPATPKAEARPDLGFGGEQNVAAPAENLLDYVPAGADVVGVLEVKALLADPSLAPFRVLLDSPDGPEKAFRETFGLRFADVERAAMYVESLSQEIGAPASPPTYLIRTVGEAPGVGPQTANGQEIPAQAAPLRKLDARTLAFRPGGGPTPAGRPQRSAAGIFGGAGDAAFWYRMNLAPLRGEMVAELEREMKSGPVRTGPGTAALVLGLARPLAMNVDAVTAAVTLGENGAATLAVRAETRDPAAAETVAATVRAALTLAGNFLDSAPALAEEPGDRMAAAMAANFARGMLAKAEVTVEGAAATLTAEMEGGVALVAVPLLLPAVQSAREAARRAQSQNNLKQIGLALHNYHDTYGHFPPAVIVEDGVPRSWRVEILPFLDQQALWEKYDKTKPWDDPANAEVVNTVVPPYKHPSDDRNPADGAFTSYFAVVAKNPDARAGRHGGPTLWKPEAPATEGGFGLRDIFDGTANTLMVVEAKRDVPWAKPEDLTYDAAADPAGADGLDVPVGGFTPGGANVALADGSVRFLADSLDPGVFRALLTRRGGEIVDRDLLDPAGANGVEAEPAVVEPPREFVEPPTRVIPTPGGG